MPVLALGGEIATGDLVRQSMESLALRVQGGVIPDCGHYVMEEQTVQVGARRRRGEGTHSMKSFSRKCVICGAELKPRQIVIVGSFPCPTCGARLQGSESYVQWVGWGSLLISVAAFLVIGFRGVALVCVTLIAFVPVLYVSANFQNIYFRRR
jgi:predicted RNA-binding Zn-ribbon protein involved in translation (DUF1610 family)